VDDQVNKLGPGLLDYRLRVEHFGKAKADIALIDDFTKARNLSDLELVCCDGTYGRPSCM